MYERMLGKGEDVNDKEITPISIIYFTARWCGACKRLDLAKMIGAYPLVAWYKCDIEDNEYTPGFCKIRKIPAFVIIKDKKYMGSIESSDTEKVLNWIQETLAEKKVES